MAVYEALYRKWRPRTFDDIVAQPHITTTLRNQILRDKTAHAYLFTGSRGTGKTTSARIFAKAVNCLHPQNGNPCLECELCKEAENGTLTDIIEIDGASNNGVDEVRNLRDSAAFMPVRCKYKIYIIDEVHMMTPAAFNALLKIIEEPPAYVKFLFATTEIHKIPSTILSRCQRFDFRRILPADIAARLQYVASHEDFTITDAAAARIAQLSDGGMRDALSLLDQCAAVSNTVDTDTVELAVGIAGTESVFAVMRHIAAHDTAAALQIIDGLYRQSKDMTRFADELSQQLRGVMLLKSAPDAKALVQCMPDDLVQLQEIAQLYTMQDVLNALDAVRQCCDRMARSANRRMELEMTLIRLCGDMRRSQGDVQALTERVAALETQLAEMMRNGVRQTPPRQTQTGSSRNDAPAQHLQVESVPSGDTFVLLKSWPSVLERFDQVNPSVSGLLQGSYAYVSDEKGVLVMYVFNRLFRRLFTNDDAKALGKAAAEITGKTYAIRYKCAESDEGQPSAVESLLERAKSSGVEVTDVAQMPI